jgi:hypothetical protein
MVIGRFAQLELRSIGVALNWSCAQLVASLNWSLRSIGRFAQLVASLNYEVKS